ncbi:glycine cleavage system protein GcvH [Desulfopila aestuarii]|uniref:Glycine cleavage system H protein n=1 Tax=Desulfopila aestuarii DSM 18488 TaxID=1121416 RepID=A0A1M7Y8P1_9BACT|nr:glycine cleavage system protein GcvH [Desulfopila aestuarii]SHO49004.1 glycine cleavage system H protein [Desulfopila aestuarii DSM 18488]
MKELNELNLPANVRYTEDHEWAKIVGSTVRIGVSDYAQDQLGDIVFVEFPEVGDSFEQGEEFGSLESVKAVSELYLPLSGEIVAINEDLADSPELINEDPYVNWIVEIKPADKSEFEELMNAEQYMDMLEG